MKYHALPLQPMQESGAALLRAMQNESMMPLDLLVREAIQNSMDAAIQGVGGEVRVDILLRSHATDTIASLLADGINSAVLRSRFPAGGRLLEIRDTLTEGLTGPLSLEDVPVGESHGNLLKLVFEIGRTRSDEGAGGSWGLGKTCYFRIGVGLVFYYSKVRVGIEFEERLVACLVENEGKAECLQSNTRTGIAWWGADELKPITKGSKIRGILSTMGIRPFGHDETGTAVIIPFIKNDLIPLSSTVIDDESTPPSPTAWWFNEYEDYLKVAIQRWFCVRVDNPQFRSGPMLTVSVNGEILRRKQMLPVFQAVQALYNMTSGAAPSSADYFSLHGVEKSAILCESVSLRLVFESAGPAGHIAAALLTPTQLQMLPPENHPDPFLCLYGHSETTAPFRPLVTFMRSPGMSIRWDDSAEARAWSGGLGGTADGRFLIAIFVPAQGRLLNLDLRDRLGAPKATLESYLRSCERADHYQWSDLAGFRIADSIRRGAGKRIREFGSTPARATVQSPAIRMARNLADLLLPQRGLGSDGRHGTSSPAVRRNGSTSTLRSVGSKAVVTLQITNTEYQEDGVLLDWVLNWGKGSGPREITLSVESESGPIGAAVWRDSGLGDFPFSLAKVTIFPCALGIDSSIFTSVTASKILLSPRSELMAGQQLQGQLQILFTNESAKELCPVLLADLNVMEKGVA